MQPMKWTIDCRLGIDTIDSQHRLLFAIANELLEIDAPAEQAPEIKYLLNHLRAYVAEHFETEERFMEKIQYPHLAVHRQLHRQIIAEINATVSSTRSLPDLVRNLADQVDRWIKRHILAEDKQIEKWVAVREAHLSKGAVGG